MDSGSGTSAAVSVVPVVPASPVRVKVAADTKVPFDGLNAGSQEPVLNAPTPGTSQYSAAAEPTPLAPVGTHEAEAFPRSELSMAQARTFGLLLTCALPILSAPGPIFRSNVFVRSPTDCVAFATFLPAIAAAVYVARTQPQQAVFSCWSRFAYGWLPLLPLMVCVAPSCSFLLLVVLSPLVPTPMDDDSLPVQVFWGAAITCCCAAVELALLSFAIPLKGKLTNLVSPRSRALNAIFTVLGLGTGEAYFWVLFSQRVTDPAERSAHLVRILISFIVILIPMQVLGSYHIGLGIACREVMKTTCRPLRCLVAPFASRWASLFVVLALPVILRSQWVGLWGFPLRRAGIAGDPGVAVGGAMGLLLDDVVLRRCAER